MSSNSVKRSIPPTFGTRPVVTLTAPDGSGKTTFLAGVAAATAGTPLVRADCRTDWRAGQFERWFCQTATRASGVPTPARQTIEAALAALRGRRFVLLLDDVQHLTDARDVAALSDLARTLPTGSLLVMAGTTLPNVPISQLRLAERVLELHQSDLLLSASDLVSEGLDDETARDLIRLTGGWAAAVAAAVASSPEEAPGVVQSALQAPLDALSPAGRTLLEEAALLGTAASSLLAEVTGGDAGALVAELRVSPVPLVDLTRTVEPTLSVHEPLRTQLVADVRRERAERGEAVAATAVRLLIERGRDDHAFDVLHAWGDRAALARLVYDRGAHLALGGRPDNVLAWVSVFDDDEIEHHPGLQLATAIAKAVTGDFTALDGWVEAMQQKDPELPWNRSYPDGRLNQSITGDRSARNAPRPDPSALPWMVLSESFQGFHLALAGHLEEAERILTALTPFCRDYAMVDLLRCVGLAYIYVRTRRENLGTSLLAYAVERAEQDGVEQHAWMMGLDASRSRYAVFAGDQAAARELLAAGVLKLSSMRAGLTPLRLFVAIELARTALWLDNVTEARRLIALADELGATVPQLDGALAELAELRSQLSERPDADAGRLTSAELRVLRRLTGPETIPEIATDLFVSASTVRAQIRALHRKLGTHDRQSTVATAKARGLL